jgi:hypothetical protein
METIMAQAAPSRTVHTVKVEYAGGKTRWIRIHGADPFTAASRLPGVRGVLACGPGAVPIFGALGRGKRGNQHE